MSGMVFSARAGCAKVLKGRSLETRGKKTAIAQKAGVGIFRPFRMGGFGLFCA